MQPRMVQFFAIDVNTFLFHSSLLNTPSSTLLNNLSEIRSPCHTPIFISNFSLTQSKTVTKLLFLYTLIKMSTYLVCLSALGP